MKKVILLAVAVVFCFSCGVMAQEGTSDAKYRALEERVKQLESIIEKAGITAPENSGEETGPAEAVEHSSAEIYHSPEEKRAAGEESLIGGKVKFGGLVETEASFLNSSDFSGGKSNTSDIVLATLQLSFAFDFDEHYSGNIVLLWEEDDTDPFAVDEGIIKWRGESMDITVGRFYPPFGTFHSHFITDPLTLELGETQESGIMFHAAPSELVELFLAVANGNVDKTGNNDRVDDYIVRADFHPATSEGVETEFGVQYISDIADTDAEVAGPGAVLAKNVPGIAADFSWGSKALELSAEYLGANGSFDPVNLDTDGDGAGDKPETWNVELSWDRNERNEIAFRFGGSRDFAGFPELVYGVDGSWFLREDVIFSAEYLYSKFDEMFSATKDSQSINTQLSMEF